MANKKKANKEMANKKAKPEIPEVARQTTRLWSIKETCRRLRIRKICLGFTLFKYPHLLTTFIPRVVEGEP